VERIVKSKSLFGKYIRIALPERNWILKDDRYDVLIDDVDLR
jgi:hypothetical protein